MQAVILAAGMGRRLKELTKDNTKCMVKVNGVSLIERMLGQLDGLGLSRVVVVTGYRGAELREYIEGLHTKTELAFIDNPVYDRTNNIYSLYLAKDFLLQEDTLLFESDIIFEERVIKALMEDERPTLALVDEYKPWMDGTCLKLDEEDRIVDFVSGKNFDFNRTEGCYKTVNIYKFSREFSQTHYVPFLEAYLKALGNNEYYEQVLRVITVLEDAGIRAKRLCGEKWYEIDDAQDLDIAETLFDSGEGKVIRMEDRFGGYWRFPELLDFCYLVNPYYPPEKMKAEMKASFDSLLTEYPSGMKVNSLLAAKNFGLHPENIVVGNGAAELIKALVEGSSGRIGVIRPTFEEYPNRYRAGDTVVYKPDNEDFSYDEKDLMGYFGDKDISTLILINPDNPSGNYISAAGVNALAAWCCEKKIRLVLDESFADFAEEEENSFLDMALLEKYPFLFVMKSISKSYGVPGLRLGILASADTELIAAIKKDVSIWNINSFAEFYMQIMEKYKKDYEAGLIKFKEERTRFVQELKKIKGLRIIPSQANYLMMELPEGVTAEKLTEQMLNEYNILIKDLTKKVGERFIRAAVRDTADNDRLVAAFRECV